MKRKRKARRRFVAYCIVIFAIVLICVFVTRCRGEVNEESDETTGGSAETQLAQTDSDMSRPENESGQMPYYYEEERAGRYEAFAAEHPEYTEDEVCWMVGADIDIPPYEETYITDTPDSLLALVNKHSGLPADYAPQDLVAIGQSTMRAEPAAALTEMIAAASDEGLNIWAASGYRSFGSQVSIYDSYVARDGAEKADTYSARAGFSEHQTGLVMDLNTINDAFGATPEAAWVAEHAWEYGFIVRYPEGEEDVTLYKYEPWHLRYIGRASAKEMHDLGIATFEEYWVKYVKFAPAYG